MNTFPVRFRIGSLDVDAIVTAFDHHQKFKVEMITGEPDPIILTRTDHDEWNIENAGQRTVSDQEFHELEKAIDRHLDELYGASKILVLTDFSDVAFNAARYAAALTHQLKTSTFILYHSYAYLPVATTTFVPIPPQAVQSDKESHEKLSRLKDQLRPLVAEQTEIEIYTDERSLVPAVNTLIEQHLAGLVVMGITGKSAIEKTLVGSNTITVAKECTIPLLIVPREAEYKGIQKIVFACDLKKVSKSTPVRAIKTFIHAMDAKLFILNVADNEYQFNPDHIEELTALHQLWDKEKPEYHYIDNEDVENGIIEFAEEHEIPLVLTVPKEYGFFESLFHHSVTRDLAYTTHIPLLLFKEDV